ncbi:MAG: hypothetical protein JSW03_07875 [Candidatus Eiseniibacteriota bacterium]|nr:MAG: hypothetical protein JSW03_07875 [Candidatus Eisenbacteria bacterium]
MKHLLLFSSLALLAGLLLVPAGTEALPQGAVGYCLYHFENPDWVRYSQGDPFPPGGATPGTNLWKYAYCIYNDPPGSPPGALENGIYQWWIFFNSDNIDRAQYVSAIGPGSWTRVYFGPSTGYYDWKVRFRASVAGEYVMPTDSLCGFEVEFTWTDPLMLPPPQNYDLVASGESEPGVTHELPPDVTPVEATTWGRLKSLFFK